MNMFIFSLAVPLCNTIIIIQLLCTAIIIIIVCLLFVVYFFFNIYQDFSDSLYFMLIMHY